MGNYVTYTQDELRNARETDMIDFLSNHNGLSFKKDGTSFRCIEHNSLVINSDRKRWFWNSHDKGGNNVLDWLQSIENLDFPTACSVVINKQISGQIKFETTNNQKSLQNKQFVMPKAIDSLYKRVYSYLRYTRNINDEILQYCFKNKLIYQDINNNAVFVGYDDKNNPRFCEQRSTSLAPYSCKYDLSVVSKPYSEIKNIIHKTRDIYFISEPCFFVSESNKKIFKEMKGKKFRGNVVGSDKHFSFHINSLDKSNDRVYVFEAPIDLLAHCSINNMKAQAVGNKNWKCAFLNHNRLSLSGTATTALDFYLKNNTQIKNIVVCTDNDDAGKRCAENIQNKYGKIGYAVTYLPSKCGKDYSEYLDLIKKNTFQNNQNMKCKF